MADDRTMPEAVDLEEAVLGAILIQLGAITQVIDILRQEMFFKQAHQTIYNALERMYAIGDKIDILTVTNFMHTEKKLAEVGGAYYLSGLTNRVASSANIEFHAYIIVQKWVLREIIFKASHAVNRAFNDDPDIFDVMDDIGDIILMRDKLVKNSSEMHSVKDLIGQEIEDYDARVAANLTGRLIGVHTGFSELNKMTMGWQGGKLIIIAGRPAMGKSAFVGDCALAAAFSKVPVAFFSLEMPELELMGRFVTGRAEVDNFMYQRGKLTDQQMQCVNRARGEINELPIFIDDTPALSITSLRAKARRMKQKHNVGLIIVDYLQLMDGKASEKKQGNREQEIASISRGLKGLAKELNLPIIALSQLSRAVESRQGDKRPQLSDLRESGAIEQDADMVLFVHRPEYYKITADEDGNSTCGMAEIIIAKHRGGSLGPISLRFLKEFTKFKDVREDKYSISSLVPNIDFLHQPKKDNDQPF